MKKFPMADAMLSSLVGKWAAVSGLKQEPVLLIAVHPRSAA